MPQEVEIKGPRFTGFREPVWHGLVEYGKLGRLFGTNRRPPTVVDAVKAARLDVSIAFMPITVQYGGDVLPASEQLAVIRPPIFGDDRALVVGQVSRDHVTLQNTELAALLDDAATGWPVEMVAALDAGASLMIVLNAGTFTVGDVTIEKYFAVIERRRGRGALALGYLPVHAPTAALLRSAAVPLRAVPTVAVSLRHGSALRAEVQTHLRLMTRGEQSVKDLAAYLGRLKAAQLSREQARSVLTAVFPTPSTPQKARLLDELDDRASQLGDAADEYERTAEQHGYRVEIANRLRAAGLEAFDGSAWSLYLAVCELADFRDQGRAESVAELALFGARAAEKDRVAVALAPYLA